MNLLDMTPAQLQAVKHWVIEDLSVPNSNGRITIWKPPVPNHAYVAGADTALGMDEGDFDTTTIFDRNTDPPEEVATIQGRWGQTKFYRVLFPALCCYNEAFLVMERQFGLPTMRMLIDELLYTYMYFDKDMARAGQPQKDVLGYNTSTGDILLTNFRRAIRDNPKTPQILIHDAATLLEIEKMQWMAHGARQQQQMLMGKGAVPDHKLKADSPHGVHNDLVRSCAMAHFGLSCVAAFEDERKKFPDGTYGALRDPEAESLDEPVRMVRTYAKFKRAT